MPLGALCAQCWGCIAPSCDDVRQLVRWYQATLRMTHHLTWSTLMSKVGTSVSQGQGQGQGDGQSLSPRWSRARPGV